MSGVLLTPSADFDHPPFVEMPGSYIHHLIQALAGRCLSRWRNPNGAKPARHSDPAYAIAVPWMEQTSDRCVTRAGFCHSGDEKQGGMRPARILAKAGASNCLWVGPGSQAETCAHRMDADQRCEVERPVGQDRRETAQTDGARHSRCGGPAGRTTTLTHSRNVVKQTTCDMRASSHPINAAE